ncbi:MAG: hypothetical protein E5X07_15915 [Mesorhizobium sp.]|uniref:hypothetical protein n=1 Tax=Mesorhizobium sp. TaxID=1871066 RepID=UPI001224C457|nr:hypothetical protein [Mesorhizobium sp.]TIR28754.1 MAG: hypothetical protein E5X35_29510 [Mesorhizobium sp.]TIS23844.1 MAG: hypothetical protein E5X07_15915 [Mesorhizobium sp.]
MGKPQTERHVRRILCSLRSSPDGNHRFGKQVIAHMRPENLGAVMRVLVLLSEHFVDVEAEFRRCAGAFSEEWTDELTRMPLVERWRASRASLLAFSGELPPKLLGVERRIQHLAERELDRRGLHPELQLVH